MGAETVRLTFEMKGIVRSDPITKRLLRSIRQGEIALIRHTDLDEHAADGLLAAGVKAIINAARTMTGRFSHDGPLCLIRAGVPIFEIDSVQFSLAQDGEPISLRDGMLVCRSGTVPCRLFGYEEWMEANRLAERCMNETVFEFAENTLRHAYEELGMLLKPLTLPKLRKSLQGHDVVIVSRGKGYKQDLAALRHYIGESKPVLVGVDGGADALVAQGYRPDLIVGDMDSVADDTLGCGAQLLVHAYMDGRAPGLERISRLGLRSDIVAVAGTSEDAAMRIAYEQGAARIVTVGSHTQPVDFMEKGRAGMASTLLVRMMIGHKLVDAKGASLWVQPIKASWAPLKVVGTGSEGLPHFWGDHTNVIRTKMNVPVSIVVPAWNEERTIAATLEALHRIRGDSAGSALWTELIVVDDGSTDRTAEIAARLATVVIVHERRLGKGAAMRSGWTRARGEIVLFADADLGNSAVHLAELLKPVLNEDADMAIAQFAVPAVNGGFGIVRRFAGNGIYKLTGLRLEAPLSGQRAVTSRLLRQIGRTPEGFGIEVGLTIDAVRMGFRICEVPLPLHHREMGKSLAGFWHRGHQLIDIGKTMLSRWLKPVL